MKQLNFQEQAFVAVYLQCFNATNAALEAGYSGNVARNHAWAWVSITGCPDNKRHVRKAIEEAIVARYGEDVPDSDWVLKRARLIADFNISKFIRLHGADAVYDFSDATTDDWYCIEEYVTEQTFRKVSGGDAVPVDKIKIKTPSKVAALKLVGDHVKVQAFREQVSLSGAVAVELTRTVVEMP